ncbi:MAG: hypothetical protein HYS21_04790 [Deltaproteobacteria bacterium]|nr:hypothetical protein [Deltaproteobacteria bacterium]
MLRRIFLTIAILGCYYNTASGASVSGLSLDPQSMECVSCHESSISAATGQACHMGSCEHPVAADYASLSLKNPGLVRPASLNPAIKLENNRMGCLSCHIPYSKANHELLSAVRKNASGPDPMLALDNTLSKLCTSCHKK